MRRITALMLVFGSVQFALPTQGAPEGPAASSETQKAAPGLAAANAATPGQTLSPATVQVLKLFEAGVSRPVVEAYIAQAPVEQALGAADLLALKDRGVPDELTIALLKRATAKAPQTRAGPPLASNSGAPLGQATASEGITDPESYGFWWYHYAYPRALAAANDRVLSSYRYLPFDAYGYYPLPFAPGRLRAR